MGLGEAVWRWSNILNANRKMENAELKIAVPSLPSRAGAHSKKLVNVYVKYKDYKIISLVEAFRI